MGLLNYSFYILMVTLVYYLYTYQFPQWLKEYKLSSLYLFIATYWIVSVLHMIMDRTPKWIWGKYKVIQKETIRDVDMIPIVFFNQVMLCAFTYFYVEYIGRGYRYGEISYMHALLEILSFYAVYDVVFYYGHRFLHIPGIYERYHKLHHLTKGSVAVSGIYMHPIDFALESILPFITGFFLVNSHLVSNLMFAAIAGVNNPHSHGGYAFFCLPLPDDHYLHHKVFNKNFALGFMDKLHGTVCSQTLKYRDDETKKIEN